MRCHGNMSKYAKYGMENGQGPRLTEMTFQDDFNKLGQDQQVKFKWINIRSVFRCRCLLSKKKDGLRLEMKQLFSNVRTLFATCISSLVMSVYMFHSFLTGLFTVLLLSFKSFI